jgi:hypothetical protein
MGYSEYSHGVLIWFQADRSDCARPHRSAVLGCRPPATRTTQHSHHASAQHIWAAREIARSRHDGTGGCVPARHMRCVAGRAARRRAAVRTSAPAVRVGTVRTAAPIGFKHTHAHSTSCWRVVAAWAPISCERRLGLKSTVAECAHTRNHQPSTAMHPMQPAAGDLQRSTMCHCCNAIHCATVATLYNVPLLQHATRAQARFLSRVGTIRSRLTRCAEAPARSSPVHPAISRSMRRIACHRRHAACDSSRRRARGGLSIGAYLRDTGARHNALMVFDAVPV